MAYNVCRFVFHIYIILVLLLQALRHRPFYSIARSPLHTANSSFSGGVANCSFSGGVSLCAAFHSSSFRDPHSHRRRATLPSPKTIPTTSTTPKAADIIGFLSLVACVTSVRGC